MSRPGIPPPDRAAQRARCEGCGYDDQRRAIGEGERYQGAAERPGDILALAADIDDAPAEGDADTHADEEEGRRSHQGVRQRVDAAECAFDERSVSDEWVGSKGKQHHRADQQGSQRGDHR